MAKDNLIKIDVYLTKENFQLLKQIDNRMVTQNFYINTAIEATAQMKKFKDMRNNVEEKEKKSEDSESTKTQAS